VKIGSYDRKEKGITKECISKTTCLSFPGKRESRKTLDAGSSPA
jgi:hypothetical protein